MSDSRSISQIVLDAMKVLISRDSRWSKPRAELRCNCVDDMRTQLQKEVIAPHLRLRKGPQRRLTEVEQREFYQKVCAFAASNRCSIEQAIACVLERDYPGIPEDTGHRYFYEMHRNRQNSRR
jgi:hypothetical protein